jgi:small subunit ribosomal protein S20
MAENTSKDEATKKSKRPTAQKRNAQSMQANVRNRSFKARVATSIRSFKEAASKNEKTEVQSKLGQVYSLLDKGVKKGVFKMNKAERVKSQMSSLASKG